MKALVIGDPHLRYNHLSKGQELLEWIEMLIIELKPDLIINLGDTLDNHKIIHSEVLSIFDAHLRRVAEDLNTHCMLIMGNHDMWKANDSKYHALQVFNGRKNVTVVDRPISREGISYIPYLPFSKGFPETTDSLVFTHNTFVGADYGFKLAEDGIDSDALNADLIISGHIHKRGYCGNGKVFYPGTPMAISAAEVDQVKGVTLMDLDSYEMKFIESPFPMWRSLRINPSDALTLDSTNHWVVTVEGPRAEVKALLESKSIVELKKQSSVTFKVEFTDKVKDKRDVIKANTVHDMVDQYIDRVYTGSLDKTLLRSEVKKTMEEVR